MKRTKFLVVSGLFTLIVILSVILRRDTIQLPTTEAEETETQLQHVRSRPKPTLRNLPHLTPSLSNQAVLATTNPPTQQVILAEKVLAPLRRAFVSPRYPSDPNLPRERQVLLSNRLLVVSDSHQIAESPSGKQSPTVRNTTPFLVLFKDPINDDARALLTRIGATVRGYFPNNALLAELTPAALTALKPESAVIAAEEFLPSDKIQPFLSSLIASYPASTCVQLSVQTFAPEDAERVAKVVLGANGTVETLSAGSRWGLLQVTLPLGTVHTLAACGAVQWIEERAQPKLFNNFAAQPGHLNATNLWSAWGLTGRGQSVGHADTGLDTGKQETLHPDFQGRVRAMISRGRVDDASDLDGHGTHTAGSILGDGTASGGKYRGIAWEATLVHQSVANAAGSLIGLPGDLYELFDESYTLGARIHSDSWGSDTYGSYTTDSRSVDLFAWDHPDHLAVFSAGNNGIDENRDGRVDLGAVGSPATAKNALTVGATENDRKPGSGGASALRWGSAWPSDYPVAPLLNDYISYSATTAPRYFQGMAAFSSRGPTTDGRIKPDVVAPGTDIISTKSTKGSAVWFDLAENSRYCYGGGTSMSTPLIAGAAALMRQYAVERSNVTNPSAALIKAMLIGGAQSLMPGQYGTNAFQEIPFTSPNVVEGWGQPDLATTVHPWRRMVRLYDRISPATGETNLFEFTVNVSHTPLDIALVWIDFPSSAGAGVTLVNDLDLLVTLPNGRICQPNDADIRDGVNTVETLRIPIAATGRYQVRVIGHQVPQSGGTAALYIRGGLDEPPFIIHTPLQDRVADSTEIDVAFHVQSVRLPDIGSVSLNWRAETAQHVTSTWQQVTAELMPNDQAFHAMIPPQPVNTRISYFLQMDSSEHGVVRLPHDTQEVFSFYLGQPIALTVAGDPNNYGIVTPAYGVNQMISEVPFKASAPTWVVHGNGLGATCVGWTGSGDVPASGRTNNLTLTLSQPSALTWLWEEAFALTNVYRLADTGQLFEPVVTWYTNHALATTEYALELGFVGSTPYAFCGWYVDNARWPDETSVAQNPARDILMDHPRTVRGDYLPFWQDSDGNGLSDWWELRYFNDPDASRDSDSDLDADGWINLYEFLDNTNPQDPTSFPQLPQITVHALTTPHLERPPWQIRATVTDNLSVEGVFLYWQEAGDATWQQVEMSWLDTDLFAAQIDPPALGTKEVSYYVVAIDLVGYYLADYYAVSPTYTVLAGYDAPWMQVTPQQFARFDLSSTPTNATLTVANLAGPDLVWTTCVAAAASPLSVTNSGWHAAGTENAWSLSTNRTWDGSAVWYCGNPLTRLYPNSCHAWLDTPAFTVGPGGGVLFRQWMKTEFDSGNYYWDGAVIGISTNGGLSFEIIEPVGGYPGLIVDNPDSPFAADQPCLGGLGLGWETYVLDLSAYEGCHVSIRFEFGSDGFVTDEGWYLAGVTPFSFDEPKPAWLHTQDTWGGILPATSNALLTAQIDPTALAYGQEDVACLRVLSNDPTSHPLIPLTVRRGYSLNLNAVGPGSVTADRLFLFRDQCATVTFSANDHAYLDTVACNNNPPEPQDFTTREKQLILCDVLTNQFITGHFTAGTWTLTVIDTTKTAQPPAGSYAVTNNTLVSAQMAAITALSSDIRQECMGWQLVGLEQTTGALSQVTFAVTNDLTLIWQWRRAYRITTTPTSGGMITPAEAWYPVGTRAYFNASPAAGYTLDTWLTPPDKSEIAGETLSFTVLSPSTLQARFVYPVLANDMTMAVPSAWLLAHGFVDDPAQAMLEDQDGDGMQTWAEWQADTNPTDPQSRFALTALRLENGNSKIMWIGGVTRTQYLEMAQSPSGPWIEIATNLPPTAISNAVTLPRLHTSGFFRIRIGN